MSFYSIALQFKIESTSDLCLIVLLRKHNFVSFVFLNSKLKSYINIGINQINDPLKRARDVKDVGHYSSGKTEIIIKEKGEIPYALSLMKQAYERS